MTRLKEDDLCNLSNSLFQFDQELTSNTGLSFKQLVCEAAGIGADDFAEAAEGVAVAVVPVTAGQGVIGNFAQSVASITDYLGFMTWVTDQSDVSGFAEAVNRGAKVVFMADDDKFIALNLVNGTLVENGKATAFGYVQALNAMAGSLNGKEVLVIGYGDVGSWAVCRLKELGASVAVAELRSERLALLKQQGIRSYQNITGVLGQFRYIFDASTSGGFLRLESLHPEVAIAAPGIPMGLTEEAYRELRKRVVHDPLQLGVGTMLAMALNGKAT